jgi:hypothetical protein
MRVQRRGRHRNDYRPGLPLELFVGVFDDPSDSSYDHIVNNVEQMLLSPCYKKSAGPNQMGCVSCHDPHEKPSLEKQTLFYRKACMNCHREKPCSEPLPQRLAKNKEDSCFACHMPSIAASDVQHVSTTDHRIPRKPPPRKADSSTGARKNQLNSLVSVFESQRGKGDPELDRDRALASGILARLGRVLKEPLNREFEAAIERDPGDVDVKVEYALRLIDRGEWNRALSLIEDALKRQPLHEDALYGYAVTCWKLKFYEKAREAWQRIIKQSPTVRGYRLALASMMCEQGKWEEAAAVTKAWIEYDPGMPEARFLMRNILRELGKTAEAQEQDRIGRKLMPKQ